MRNSQLWDRRNRERTRLLDQVLLDGNVLARFLAITRLLDPTEGRLRCRRVS